MSFTRNNNRSTVSRRALSIKSTSDLRAQTPQLSGSKPKAFDEIAPAPTQSSQNSNEELETFEGGARENTNL